MKKLILVLMLFVVSFIAQAQDSTLVTNTNTEKLIDKYSAKLEASIVSLADTLKQPAEHVYKILIKQQVIISYELLLILLFAILFGMTALIFSKGSKWGDRDYYNNRDPKTPFWIGYAWNIKATFTLIFGLLSLLFLLISILTMNRTFSGFLNPEYGAIKDIMKML